MGLGEGISNAPMQGSTRGTPVSFNSILYDWGHIPPPSPYLGTSFQQPSRPSSNYNLFGVGGSGPLSYTTLVVSISFSLFNMFDNNAFSSVASRLWETLVLDNKILCGVIFLHRGKVQEFSPHKDFGILGRDQFHHKGCRSGETPSMVNGTPGRDRYLSLSDRWGTSPSKILGTQCKEKSPPNQHRPTMGVSWWFPNKHNFCKLVKTTIFTRTLANSPTFLGNLVPFKLQVPFFLYIVPNPNYLF